MAVIKSVRTLVCSPHALNKAELAEFLEPLSDDTHITVVVHQHRSQRNEDETRLEFIANI